MSLLDLYNTSTKPRVTQARQIPDQAVHFFDLQSKFEANEFALQRKQGDPTDYTPYALDYYDYELTNMVIPQSFIRTDPSIPLMEWNPTTPYYTPGAPGTEGSN